MQSQCHQIHSRARCGEQLLQGGGNLGGRSKGARIPRHRFNEEKGHREEYEGVRSMKLPIVASMMAWWKEVGIRFMVLTSLSVLAHIFRERKSCLISLLAV